jgi:hypothetical protein
VSPFELPTAISGRRPRRLQIRTGFSGPSLSMLVLHDDADREFDYTAGAERALAQAEANGWTVASLRDDWVTVFGD